MSNGLSNDEILAKFLNREIDASALQGDEELSSWMALAEEAATLDVPATKTKEEAWKQFSAKIAKESQQEATIRPLAAATSNNRSMAPWMAGVAAAITLLIGVYFFWPQGTSEFSTGAGEVALIELPDGSRATLNEHSSLSYDAANWADDRGVEMNGHVFFQVKKGETFTVHTPDVNVQVLGTSFGVKSSPELTAVSCITGKVKVFDPEAPAKAEIITADEMVTFNHQSDEAKLGTLNESKTLPNFMRKEISIENRPISEVFDVFEQHFNMEVVYKGPGDKMYTGTFYTDKIENALQLICDPMGFRFIFEGEEKVLIQVE